MKHSLAGLWLLALSLMTGCTQPDGPVGSGVGSSLGGRGHSSSVPVERDTSFAVKEVKTGGSPYCYVGRAEGIHSQSLFRFNRPLAREGWVFDSTRTPRIHFHFTGGIGTGDLRAAPSLGLQASLKVIQWSEAEPPPFDSSNSGEVLPLQMSAASGDSGMVTAFIRPEWVKQWLAWVDSSGIDTSWSDPNRPDSALTVLLSGSTLVDRLLRFRSRNSVTDSLKPKLTIYMQRPDTTNALVGDSLIIAASADLFLLINDSLDAGSRLVVGSGAAFQTNLQFNLDSLAQAAQASYLVVNRAILTLHRDRTQFLAFPPTPSLWPFLLEDSLGFSLPDSARQTGLTVTPTAVDSSRDAIEVLITDAVDRWVRDPAKNWGIAVHSGGVGLDINRIAFHTPRAGDPALRPTLRVYYTVIPR